MALRNAILAMLLDADASGYDLAKSFDSSVANFWTATPQQLYRELDKMESQGAVRAQVVEQQGRPNKRLFSLTETGLAELAEFTTRAPKATAVRDELLVQVQALESGDSASIRQAVEARRATAEAKLQRYERLRERLLGGHTEVDFLATAERVGPYLTLARGLTFEQENIRWCEYILTVLSRRSRPPR